LNLADAKIATNVRLVNLIYLGKRISPELTRKGEEYLALPGSGGVKE
jgi:hypothetical protein